MQLLTSARCNLLQRWCENAGFVRGAEPVDPCGADITNPDKAGNLFTRFFQWWYGGRAGDPSSSKGRKVRAAEVAIGAGLATALQR